MKYRYPKLTVITPSFNQAEFLERTLDSVISQGYPNLEYIVVDGGSTDGSIEIIRRYERHLAWWVSEKDRGQVHALNKGLERATGEWVGWQNSDDIYLAGAFEIFAEQVGRKPSAGVVAGCLQLIDADDRVLREVRYVRPTYQSLRAEGMVIANQAAFWRRSVQNRIGFMDERYQCSFDYDWFLRLLRRSQAAYVDRPLGALRLHSASKSSDRTSTFVAENLQILGGSRPPAVIRATYMLRRAAGVALNGHVAYVLGGIARRSRLKRE